MLKLNQITKENCKNKSSDSKGEHWKNKGRNARLIELYTKKDEFYYM